MSFHAIAILSGDRQKTLPNRSEVEILTNVVIPFVASGVVTAKWGKDLRSYQVLELRVYETRTPWDKKRSTFYDHIRRRKNVFARFEKRAKATLAANKPRVFVVTPIQGEKTGDQEQQRIHREYEERFECVERVVSDAGGIAIRIDKEHPLEDLAARIKREIRGSLFTIADITDERPSCYFEVGYAEGTGKKVIYIASKQSVVKPGSPTRIHFDIHRNVQFFTNLKELEEKLAGAIEKNRAVLFDIEPVSIRAGADD
jgi:predicted DNA-binding protein YlxM (UPF0122 family)